MESNMSNRLVLAVGALGFLGACASTPMPDFAPLESMTHAVTPETAQTLADRGFFTQAIAGYRAALKSNPEDAVARYGLAEALRKTGKADDAKTEFGALLANPAWKVRALEGMGRISFAAGDRTLALGLFNQAVAEDPKASVSWLGIAQIQDLNRDWAKADEAYAFALSSSIAPAIVLNNHGVSKLARGEAAQAAELFRGAISADPKMERAKINLELAEAVKGKSVQAVSASEQDARERARALNNYGYVAMLQDRPEDARAFYQAAIKEHPAFYPKAYQNLKALDAEEVDDAPTAPSKKPKG
jgi:Flp pilus assembly protein TadD